LTRFPLLTGKQAGFDGSDAGFIGMDCGGRSAAKAGTKQQTFCERFQYNPAGRENPSGPEAQNFTRATASITLNVEDGTGRDHSK
jgi:hypothetical protein